MNPNISDSKKSQDELADSFIVSIVHDLKNLMVPIMSRSEMLQMPDLSDEKRKAMLKMLNANCYVLMDAMNKMVRICKDRANVGEHNPVSFNLYPLAIEVVDVLDEGLQSKSLSTKILIDKDLSVYADRDAILSVLTNLVGNAVKFTPKGGSITVSATLADDVVTVSVADTGVGVNASMLTALLDDNRYFSTVGTDGETGTGLGLMLCESRLRRNNSKLEFANNSTEGATFSFKLPVK